MRQVIIYFGEDGYWVVECPSLPGCISQGKTREEAINNIREAIRGYITALENDNIPVPKKKLNSFNRSMSKLPRISGNECVKALEKAGFVFIR